MVQFNNRNVSGLPASILPHLTSLLTSLLCGGDLSAQNVHC